MPWTTGRLCRFALPLPAPWHCCFNVTALRGATHLLGLSPALALSALPAPPSAAAVLFARQGPLISRLGVASNARRTCEAAGLRGEAGAPCCRRTPDGSAPVVPASSALADSYAGTLTCCASRHAFCLCAYIPPLALSLNPLRRPNMLALVLASLFRPSTTGAFFFSMTYQPRPLQVVVLCFRRRTFAPSPCLNRRTTTLLRVSPKESSEAFLDFRFSIW